MDAMRRAQELDDVNKVRHEFSVRDHCISGGYTPKETLHAREGRATQRAKKKPYKLQENIWLTLAFAIVYASVQAGAKSGTCAG